jgi:hypothetical protein
VSARVIVLGNRRSVPLGAYVAGIKACAAAPAGTEYRHGLTGDWSATREEILADWRASVHDRINLRVPTFGHGRKWSHDWQREAGHAARELNHPRLRIYWLPVWLRERFAHRIAEREQ